MEQKRRKRKRFRSSTEEEVSPSVSEQANDLEWKEFIQQELEKLKTQEKEDEKIESEGTTSTETEFTLGSLVEKIPLEDLIDTAVRKFVKKKKPVKKTIPEKRVRPRNARRNVYRYRD
ncbi:hypothetical protein [Gracilibacillus kekensis]|uniref:Uncharacterized protein n=1 Tax=Gracilibacillus kekensis TaxID=1027249 RepID=A0A1M7L6S4_9BACI|nr:hypothetical protein [Gracilibacillus kekensis]SHM73666.1 hypothetical protein SAMN05216179_0961 [Gracilibacillus kekensis]